MQAKIRKNRLEDPAKKHFQSVYFNRSKSDFYLVCSLYFGYICSSFGLGILRLGAASVFAFVLAVASLLTILGLGALTLLGVFALALAGLAAFALFAVLGFVRAASFAVFGSGFFALL